MAKATISPPSDLLNIEECSDWIELLALTADDGNSSAGDLERALRRGGLFNSSSNEDEAIEQHTNAVLSKLAERESLVGRYYPFRVIDTKLQKSTNYTEEFLPYVFCLCLSFFRRKHPTVSGVNPRLLFESVSAAALEGYLGSADTLIFGTGRGARFRNTVFKNAVNDLARFIGEGEEFLIQPSLSKKDDHVDVVAVKHFPDRKHGKLLVFGQCATGENWEAKISELDPHAFCRQWLKESVTSTPALSKGFFIPFVVPISRWRYNCNYAGILFERLRLSHYASIGKSIRSSHAGMQKWVEACLS